MALCIYNNTRDGHDREILQAFKERAWNNPVVRIVTPDRRDIVATINRDWTVRALAATMTEALASEDREVPTYLKLLAVEQVALKRGVETAVFGMG